MRDCNAFNIQFRTCNRDVNMVAAGDPFFLRFWCHGSHPRPRQHHYPAFRKKCKTCGIVGHFARASKGGTRKQAGSSQPSNFVDEDADEEEFVAECKATTGCAKNSSLIYTLFRREVENCKSTNRLSFNLQHRSQQVSKPVIP